jgi:hypothetical protein
MSYSSDEDEVEYYNESSDEYDDEDIMYDADELSPTKFNIVLCELYNKKIHGGNKKLNSHYMVIGAFRNFDIHSLNRMSRFYNRSYLNKLDKITPHSCIRNYKQIVTMSNYVKPEIAQTILLPGGEQICILKTFWIRLIQRAWRRIFQERHVVIRMRSNPRYILNRQLGRRSRGITSLRGMLNFDAFRSAS